MPSTKSLIDDAHCFVCGQDNEQGLKLTWTTEGNKTTSSFIPSKTFAGWQGVVHGGILATVLDEAITRLAWQLHGQAVTAELKVRYHHPAKVGEELSVVGEIVSEKKGLIMGQAEIKNKNNELIASASGKALKQ